MINLNEMKKDYIGREPRDYIVESVTVPEGLEEKVLAAMTQKRKEIEEIHREKQEKKAAHKSVALRATVIAAVITLMILIIPSSRQVVVSAAEKIWEYVGELIDPLYYTNGEGSGSYYLENGKGTATVTTQELNADTIDLSDFDYESYPKAIDCKIKSDNITISLGKMFIDSSGYYYDLWINECSLNYSMKDKFSQLTYTMGEGLEYENPDYYFCHLSYTSNVEVVFLRNDKPLFRVKYLISTKDNSQTKKTNKLNYGAELLPWEIIWTDEGVEKRFNTDETDDLISIKEMVQQLKPDKLEVASVSINIDEYTDLKAVASEDKMKQLEKEGYNCIDGVDDCCIMCRFNAHIIKCYNANYYNIKKERKNNKRIVEEYNEAVEMLKEAE